MAAGEILQRLEVLTDLDRYDDADPLLAALLAAEPDHERGLVLRIRGLAGRHRVAEAEAVTRQLLSVKPDSVGGLTFMARLQAALGRPRDGVPFARRLVELYPNDAQCLEELASVLKAVPGGALEAVALLERAVAIEPGFALAYQIAGGIYLNLGRYADAERWTLQALSIEPASPVAVLRLSFISWKFGRLDESRVQLVQALQMKATPSFMSEAVNDLEACGLPGHLIEVYRMALAARGLPDLSYPGAAGDDAELIAAQGRLACRMCSRDSDRDGRRRAGQLAAAVLAVDPGNQNARYVRSLELSAARQNKEALTIAQQLAAEGYPAKEALHRALMGLGDYAAALAIVEAQLANRSDHPGYLTRKADYLRRLERCDEALQAAVQAEALSPSAPEVQLQVGMAAKCAGDLALAERALRAAVADAPADGYPAAELALLLAETNRWPEAEMLAARLTQDLPDAPWLAEPCLKIALACLPLAVSALRDMDPHQPSPVRLDQAAGWLGLVLRMYTVAGSGYFPAAQAAAGKLVPVVAALRTVVAPPESSFARVVQGFDELLHGWRAP